MKPIVITQELISDQKSEINTIKELISEFRCRVHIRKKNCTEKQLDNFCCELSESTDCHYLTLHGHEELVEKHRFGGFHDKERGALPKDFLYSTSCHSIAEAEAAVSDYLFLSPIFDSISKHGYSAAYDYDVLREWFATRERGSKIVALGGIDRTNARLAYDMGFDGVALLGAIWNSTNAITNYNNILLNL